MIETTEQTPAQQALRAANLAKNQILLEEGVRENALRNEKIVPLENQVRSAEAEVNAIIRAEFAERIASAEQAVRAAKELVDAEKIASVKPKYGPDIVLCEWIGHFCAGTVPWYTSTGKRGRMEVWTKDSKVSSNLAGYSIPYIGDVVIRLLKADGSPSLKIIRGKWDIENSWLPEGQKPEGAR